MPAIAQGIRKTISVGLQTALNVPNVTTGQILRRRTSMFKADRDMFESDEIVSHQMTVGNTYGLKKITGKLDGLCSASTYQILFENILGKTFAAITPLVLGVDVTSQAVAPQFVDASGGLLAGGIKAGDVVAFTGFTTTAVGNNSRNFWISALTATNITGVFLDGGPTVLPKAPETGSVTITVVGKKCLTPLTGHTNSYLTVEEFYADLVRSELFVDCKVGQIAIGLPASGNATFSADFVGLGRTLGAAQQVATRAVETVTPVITATSGFLMVNGAINVTVTGVQITISNSVASMGAVIGTNTAPDVSKGRVKVVGSFTGLFDSATLSVLYDAETNISLSCVAAGDKTALASFLAFTMGRIKLTGDSPDDGEKGIVRTYPFSAELNLAGGPVLAFDQTILTIQDSNAA
jgi:hypothetical protein